MKKDTVQKLKTAKITTVMAISIVCEECDEFCEDQYGSTMISSESATVECRYCHASYSLPTNAFQIMSKSKCIAIKETQKQEEE